MVNSSESDMKTIVFDDKNIVLALGFEVRDFEINLAYKLYLAYESGDVDEITKAEIEVDVNSILYQQHRFN